MKLSIRTIMLSIIFVICSSGIRSNCMADDIGMVNLKDYSQYVVDLGGANEDWQPAFQQALTVCSNTGSTLFVPCGTYNVRQTIVVPGIASSGQGFNDPGRLTIKGAGRLQSLIAQQDNTKNVMDWTASTYEGSYGGGTLQDISLSGGKTCLNIKWHNQFRMFNCYIEGAEEYGVYAEGWSNRFLNSIVRWCLTAGIYGGGHFNDAIIRDCYLSRNGVGVYLNGGTGARIDGCGMELNGNCAVFVDLMRSTTISNCYFEGNGYELQYFDTGSGFPSSIHINYQCSKTVIKNNVFRGSSGFPFLSLSYSIEGVIEDNVFENNAPISKSKGIILRNECEGRTNFPCVARTSVKNNYFENVEQWLCEEEPGMLDSALYYKSVFQKNIAEDVVSVEQLGAELVVDGDMELTGVTNWSDQYTPATKEKSVTYAQSGIQSLHITSDSSGDGVCQIFTPSNPLGSGKVYKVSLWVKNMDPDEYLNFKIDGADGTIYLKTYDTEWTPFVFYCTFDSYAGSQYFCIAYGTTSSDVYIDDVSIREVVSTGLF